MYPVSDDIQALSMLNIKKKILVQNWFRYDVCRETSSGVLLKMIQYQSLVMIPIMLFTRNNCLWKRDRKDKYILIYYKNE